MPERVYSALNTNGTSTVTDPERFGMQYAAQLQDNAVRQAMLAEQARQFNASLADRGADRQFQQVQNGTFAQKVGADVDLQKLRDQGQLENTRLTGQNQLGVAGLETEAPRRRSALEERQYNDLSGVRDAEAQSRIEELTRRRMIQNAVYGDALSGAGQPQGQAGPFSSFTDRDRRRVGLAAVGSALGLGGALAGDDPDETVRRQLDSTIASKAVELLSSGNQDQRSWAANFLKQRGVDLGSLAGPAAGQDSAGGAVPSLGASPVTPDTIRPLIENSLPDYINKDTDSWWSRGLKGAGTGATALGAAGAGVGSLAAGVGAIPGLVIGGGLGGVGGFFSGALSGPNKPSQDDQDRLVDLYTRAVDAFKRQNGGDESLAKQQARALFDEIAKTRSGQKEDYLTDADASGTRALFGRLQ